MQASGYLLSGTPIPLGGGRTPTPADRSHMAGPLGETAVQQPGTGGSLPAGASTLSKSGSLQGAASTAVPQSQKKTGPLLTAAAVAVALMVGVVVSRRNAGAAHDAATAKAIPVQVAASPPAPAEPPAAAATAVASAAAPSAAPAAIAAPEISAGAEPHVGSAAPMRPTHAAAPVTKTASPPKPAAAPAAPAANATAEQIKGRTIRTDL
jgi:Meckel syndrome type 1 protein